MLTNGRPHEITAELVESLIKLMSVRERRRLFRDMEYDHDWMLNYVMVPAKLLDLMDGSMKTLCDAIKTQSTWGKGVREALAAARKCHRARRVVKQRNDIILKECLGNGITDGHAIRRFMVENHPELVRGKGLDGFMSARSLMTNFRRPAGGDDCNHRR